MIDRHLAMLMLRWLIGRPNRTVSLIWARQKGYRDDASTLATIKWLSNQGALRLSSVSPATKVERWNFQGTPGEPPIDRLIRLFVNRLP